MTVSTITGAEHATRRCRVSTAAGTAPIGWTATILFLRHADGEIRPYWPLYDYELFQWTRSQTWQNELCRAVGLFWDYGRSRSCAEPIDELSASALRDLFRAFFRSLVNGTVDLNCTDPLMLYWLPQTVQFVRKTVSRIEDFVAWLSMERGIVNPLAPARGPSLPASGSGNVPFDNARRFRLLGHLGGKKGARGSIVTLPDSSSAIGAAGPRVAVPFPAMKMEALLWDGLRRPGTSGQSLDDYDCRAMMIALAQAYGGLRIHEVLHLWVTDVIQDPERPDQASIFLYHPVRGLAYADGLNGRLERVTREQKLLRDYGLPPRTRGCGSYRLGWKNSSVHTSDQYALIHWTDPVAAKLFLKLVFYYVARRETIMVRRRALGFGDHPFLLVSEREARSRADGASFIGAPASIGSYRDSLRSAVSRIGLPYRKDAGTTSHGLRHFYAYTLRLLGPSRKVMQIGLRHRHPYSQDVYGVPSPAQISNELESKRLAAQERDDPLPALARSMAWIEEQHPEYSPKPLILR